MPPARARARRGGRQLPQRRGRGAFRGRAQAQPPYRVDDPAGVQRGQQRPRLRRRHHLGPHLQPVQELHPWPAGPPQAAVPVRDAVQRGDPVRHHRHGLHEREPGRPRRARARAHLRPHALGPQGRLRVLEGPGRPHRARPVADHRGRPAGVAQHPLRPLRRHHAQRGRDRRRQDRGPGQVRLDRRRLARQRGRALHRRRYPGRDQGADRRVLRHLRARSRRPRPGGVPSPRRGPGCPGDRHRALPRRARLQLLLRPLRRPRRHEAAAVPLHPAPYAEGLRLRPRGRLEDPVHGPHDEGHDLRQPERPRLRAARGLHLQPGPGQGRHPRVPHVRGRPLHRRGQDRDPRHAAVHGRP